MLSACRGTHPRTFAVVVVVTLALLAATPSIALAGTDPTTQERCERQDGKPKRCVGPVTDESGGGGGALTIVVSVVIGLAVAGAAFVLVRKQLASGGRAR